MLPAVLTELFCMGRIDTILYKSLVFFIGDIIMKRNYLGVIMFIIFSVSLLTLSAILDYYFFHVIVNMATIFLGLMIFVIAVFSREYSKGSNLLFVGVAYLSISVIDLMHISNESILSSSIVDLNISSQLWIGARFTEAYALYLAYSKVIKRPNINLNVLYASFGATTLIILGFVALNDYFPLVYDIEVGYTLYKQVLDIIIIALFVLAFVTISKKESRQFNKRIILGAIAIKILAVIVYLFDNGNMVILESIRYILQYISYILIFLVFAIDLLQRPYENIFRAFKEKEAMLLELSRKDSLTGLYNHSTSYEILRDIIKKNNEEKKKICLLMIDVDNFKCINDKYGHVKGDEILVRVAAVFRENDDIFRLSGRYGGDEFVVLVVDCDGEKAKTITGKIFVKMEELSSELDIKVTISIGIAEWQKGFTAKDLVKSADYKMYEAKSVGKNTFRI